MFWGQHCDSGSTILFNIVENEEQGCPKTMLHSVFNNLLITHIFCRVGWIHSAYLSK